MIQLGTYVGYCPGYFVSNNLENQYQFCRLFSSSWFWSKTQTNCLPLTYLSTATFCYWLLSSRIGRETRFPLKFPSALRIFLFKRSRVFVLSSVRSLSKWWKDCREVGDKSREDGAYHWEYRSLVTFICKFNWIIVSAVLLATELCLSRYCIYVIFHRQTSSWWLNIGYWVRWSIKPCI